MLAPVSQRLAGNPPHWSVSRRSCAVRHISSEIDGANIATYQHVKMSTTANYATAKAKIQAKFERYCKELGMLESREIYRHGGIIFAGNGCNLTVPDDWL